MDLQRCAYVCRGARPRASSTGKLEKQYPPGPTLGHARKALAHCYGLLVQEFEPPPPRHAHARGLVWQVIAVLQEFAKVRPGGRVGLAFPARNVNDAL